MYQGSVIFLSHGGGPLPLLNDPNHEQLNAVLKQLAADIPKPDAIVIISAHWEANGFEIGNHPNPELIYDYGGFPDEAYAIEYPAPGEPQLAQRIHSTLSNVNGLLPATLNPKRGYDHGVFVPLKIMFPDADIPIVPISLDRHLDPEQHVKLGESLKDLLQENILIVGSGFSFHNMQAFFNPNDAKDSQLNLEFEQWLEQTLIDPIAESERRERLIQWAKAPGALFCHPREEHLIPIHTCYGAAGGPVSKTYSFQMSKIRGSAYLWNSSNINK